MPIWQDTEGDGNMDNEWVRVAYKDEIWWTEEVFINTNTYEAKIVEDRCVYCGHHDEERWAESEKIVSIEQAIEYLYPNEEAISCIKQLTGKDYADLLAKLEKSLTDK